jgi:mRNA-degrading endonuclease RelE of RelBE toxin-antitoxin system
MIFIEDHGFQKRRKGLMEDEELFRLLEWLAVHPELGKVIPASGGLRKIRWAGKGHGKRGGVRIIYFWWVSADRILLLDVDAKSEQENLTASKIEELKRKVTL